MGAQKGKIQSIKYATDYVYPDGYATATFTEIPIRKVIQEGAQLPRETAVTQRSINGADLQAGVENRFAVPVIQDDDDTFLTALKTASAALTPVWFAFKLEGEDTRVVGGREGCQVTVAESAAAQFGSFNTSIVGGSTTGADTGDTMERVIGS